MSQIVKHACEELGCAEISCTMVGNTMWMKGNGVAKILGYKKPQKAESDHVLDKFKSTLGAWLVASGPPKSGGPCHNDFITTYISEAGLYKLIFKSQTESAEIFSYWVCEDVLPQIRKTGSYMSHDEAVNKIRNPTGETKLHYKVKAYIARSTQTW